jgi:hypothetical protein
VQHFQRLDEEGVLLICGPKSPISAAASVHDIIIIRHNTSAKNSDHCWPEGESYRNYIARCTMANNFLNLYDTLPEIGRGTFGIVRRVRRKSDGMVRFYFAVH